MWRTLGRHQVGAAASTVIDFGLMIALVQLAGVSADLGTAAGAVAGGVLNFIISRRWIFRGHAGHWATQAVWYVVVSGSGAGLNVLGEHLLHDVAGVQYLAARVVVSFAVGLLWNFPMQRRFVFRDGRA